jgi:hypothetical protein
VERAHRSSACSLTLKPEEAGSRAGKGKSWLSAPAQEQEACGWALHASLPLILPN